MNNKSITTPQSWLAFELNVLRRMDFTSAALPLIGHPALGVHLKRNSVRVTANDPLQSSWIRAVAAIQNNGERLSEEDVNIVLEDVYVPAYKLKNPSLRTWFSETDAWWFDNIRNNIDRLASPIAHALATTLAMAVGDYVLSFTEETGELRQPLSNVFRRLWTVQPEAYNNGQNNACSNKNADDFIAQTQAELMFLRLPATASTSVTDKSVWREEWLRGGSNFWLEFENSKTGRIGAQVETKSQYLQLLEQTLVRAKHIKTWAIAHVEGGYVSSQDIIETVGSIRRVDTVFTKDFSELTGSKAVIITA